MEQFVFRNLREQLRQHQRVADGVVGNLDGANLQRLRIHAQMHLAPLAIGKSAPCLLIFHSPSPSIFTSVLSTSKCKPPRLERAVMSTLYVFWRRDRVL